MQILLFTSESRVDLCPCGSARDGRPLSPDDQLLQDELIRAGAKVEVICWQSYKSGLGGGRGADLALIRAPWTSPSFPVHCAAWLREVACEIPVRNALAAISWNLNRYHCLKDVAAQGFPILPTIWLHPREPRALASLLTAIGWKQAVLKPVCGGGASSSGTHFFTSDAEQVRAAQSHLEQVWRTGQSMMLQPAPSSVQEEGVHSYVFLGGKFSHAFKKAPEGTLSFHASLDEPLVMHPPQEEILLANQIMEWVGTRLGQEAVLFGSVDLVRHGQADLCIMDLCLIDPVLHLEYCQALSTLVGLIFAQGSHRHHRVEGPGAQLLLSGRKEVLR